MPIKIPADAKIVRDSRITLITVINTLYARHIKDDGGIKDQVKETLEKKKAGFAESDVAVAALRPGTPKSSIDVHKLYKLVDAGTITIKQFLDCVTASRKPLEQFMSGAAIDKISTLGDAPSPSLYTEFKDGVELDLERITSLLTSVVSEMVPITSA